MDARSLVETVLSGKDRPFGVRLWDGTALPPVHPPGVPILVIAHERGAAAFGPPPNEEKLAEAFISGDIDVDGDLVDFVDRASGWSGPETLPATALAAGLVAEMGSRAGELLRSALLGYLAVAHYGRGRGDWAASEHPGFWAEAVDAALAARAEERRALWAALGPRSRVRGDPAALRAALERLLRHAGADLLRRLYPAAPPIG